MVTLEKHQQEHNTHTNTQLDLTSGIRGTKSLLQHLHVRSSSQSAGLGVLHVALPAYPILHLPSHFALSRETCARMSDTLRGQTRTHPVHCDSDSDYMLPFKTRELVKARILIHTHKLESRVAEESASHATAPGMQE